MNSLILLGSIQCLILLFFICLKRKKTAADFILMLLFGFFTFLFGFIYFTQEFDKDHLTSYLLNSGLLIAALFTFYVQKLLDHKPEIKAVHYLLFAPYALTSFLLFAYYAISKNSGPVITSFYDFIHVHQWVHDIFRYLNIAIGPAYFIIIIILIKQDKRHVVQVFSSTEKVEKRWVRDIVAVALLLWFLTAILGKFGTAFIYPHFTKSYGVTWGLSSLLFVYMGYKGFKHQSVFFDLPVQPVNSPKAAAAQKYGHSGLKEQDFDHLANKIIEYTETQKPYLNPQLTIFEFASGIAVPPYQISQLLNEYYKTNFFDFINQYRVDEFKKQAVLPENKNYSIQAVAFDCGFNSKSSFYRIFKKQTQLTPSQYLDSLPERKK